MSSSPEFAFLLDLGMATIAALGFTYVFSRLKLPVVLGQLVAGIVTLSSARAKPPKEWRD